jgi:two-component system cell cycle response regulator
MSPQASAKTLPPELLRADNLPSLPTVALEVLRIAGDERSTLDEMAQCLSRDPALAAKLLKLANSAAFGGTTPVTTLQRATMMLGMKTVKLMALSFSLVGSLPRSGREGSLDLGAFWHRSLVTAIAARSMARLARSASGDEAFLCGLFSHFGKLVLARCLPESYEPVVESGDGWPSVELEQELLGFTSSDVCAALLKQWHLPELIWRTIEHASSPEPCQGVEDPVLRNLIELLRMGHLAERVLCGTEKGKPLSELHTAMESRGIPSGEVDAFLLGLESGINETAELLSLSLPQGMTYEQILDQARQQMVAVSLGTAVDLAAERRRNLELEDQKRQLETRALTDGLTGLPNRRAFDGFLATQVGQRMTTTVPRALGLLLVDIDHFKQVNDTHGHAAGDEVLRMLAGVLKAQTRQGDMAARYGGEEFAVVFPQTNPFGLRDIAERLREAVARETVAFEGRELRVTASVGGACIVQFDTSSDELALIKLADHFLYQAKNKGRNRVELYPKMSFPGRL